MLLATAGALAASPARAQAPPGATPTPQQLNPAEQVETRVRPRANDIFVAPEPGPCPLRGSDLTFELKGVEFAGATGSEEDLVRSYKGLVGQTIPVSAICDIRDRAAAILFAKGVLARVEIPEQKIAEGQLRLEVIQARIANIRFHGDAGPAQGKIEDYLEKLRGMTPFNLNLAQRYLLLAADVPGVQISAAIRPSSQGRGAVDLDVAATHDLIDVAANVQNFGSETMGPWAGLARVDFKGLTRFGDRTGVVLYSTLDGREQRIVQLLGEARPGDDGLLLRGSFSYAQTHPSGALAPLKLEGTATDLQLSAAYPLVRRREGNINLGGGLDIVDQSTDFGGGGALIDDKLRIVFLRAEATTRTRIFGVPFNGDVAIEARQGLDALGASQAGEAALSRAAGEPDALVGRMEAHAVFGWTPWLQTSFGAALQYADSPLLSYEQLAVGNLTIGRGYDPSSVAGDRGGALAFETRLGPFALPLGLQAQLYGFYDSAHAELIDIDTKVTVHSAGGGLRLASDRGVDIDVFYAAPFDKPSLNAPGKPPSRVMVSLTLRR